MAAMDFLVVLVVLSLALCGMRMGVVADNAQQIADLMTRVDALEAQVQADHDGHHAILFSAFRSSAANVVANEPIVFNEVILNNGEAYNATTGIFTSPQDGIYSLSYSAILAGGAEVQVVLVKSGVVWRALHGDLPNGSNILSERTSVLRVDMGEQVWLEVQQGVVLGVKGVARMSFQGYHISD